MTWGLGQRNNITYFNLAASAQPALQCRLSTKRQLRNDGESDVHLCAHISENTQSSVRGSQRACCCGLTPYTCARVCANTKSFSLWRLLLGVGSQSLLLRPYLVRCGESCTSPQLLPRRYVPRVDRDPVGVLQDGLGSSVRTGEVGRVTLEQRRLRYTRYHGHDDFRIVD